MALQGYAAVLRVQQARSILLLGLLIRIPMWALNVALTLHVVKHLGLSYTMAGLITTAATVAQAVSAPWRGRLLDRIGLRRTVFPSLVVLTVCWAIGPWAGYWVLLPLVFAGGLFTLPTFSIVRQVLLVSVPQAHRKSALAIDSVAVELSFMAGPALGVWLATSWQTPGALLLFGLLDVAGGALLWLRNPAISSQGSVAAEAEPPTAEAAAQPSGEIAAHSTGAVPVPQHDDPQQAGTRPAAVSRRDWVGPMLLAVLGATAACTVVLTGTDVAVVAMLRQWGYESSIGWVLTLWGLGSAIGGLIYGALRRHPSAFVLTLLLGAATIPVALADQRWTMAVLLVIAGMFCAPAITASIDALTRLVPEQVRGEALGWHGAALTAGTGLGAPVVGFVIDRAGARSGFVAAGAVGVMAGGVGLALSWYRRHRRGSDRRRPERAGQPVGG